MADDIEIGGEEGTLWVSGIVASRDHMPYIVLSKGTNRVAQMSMAQARNLAGDLLVMASRTEADAMLLKFFESHEFPREAGAALMVAFRDFRAELDGEEGRGDMSPEERASRAMGEEELAPGVWGHRFDTPEGIYIPVINASRPGSGEVGRYLDSLPRDRRVVFPVVISERLRGMLEQRGFVASREWSEEFGEDVEIMVRG